MDQELERELEELLASLQRSAPLPAEASTETPVPEASVETPEQIFDQFANTAPTATSANVFADIPADVPNAVAPINMPDVASSTNAVAAASSTDAIASVRARKPYLRTLLNGLWRENPTLRLVLGTCPTLAVTTTAIGGVSMGVTTLFVLLCSNIVVSLLRRLIPGQVRLPAYIVVIAGFTTIVQLLVQAFLPAVVNDTLGIFLPLITVNCIILGRAEAFAGKHSVGLAALDGIGMGIGFTGALLVMGMTRELLGAGTIFGLSLGLPAIGFFALPAGGFFIFGVLMWFTGRVNGWIERKPQPILEADCAQCSMAVTCGVSGRRRRADA